MKKVLILLGKKGSKSTPFKRDSYRVSYEAFYSLCEKSGIKMYRASYQEYDHAKKYFRRAWFFDTAKKSWLTAKKIVPDLIFDKTPSSSEIDYAKELLGENLPFFNSLEFTQIVRNKLAIGLLFSKWSKKYWLVESKHDFKKLLPKIRTERLVVKPIRGGGGKGVQVLEKKSALKAVRIQGPYLVQEYIDSSAGVPGVSNSVHDLRLVMVNDKMIYSYLREPEAGSYLANCSQGGCLKIVPLKNIPKNVYPIIKHANNLFDSFSPRFYSVDIMFDGAKKPWIVELNAMPGLNLCAPEERPYLARLYKELIKVFIKRTQ